MYLPSICHLFAAIAITVHDDDVARQATKQKKKEKKTAMQENSTSDDDANYSSIIDATLYQKRCCNDTLFKLNFLNNYSYNWRQVWLQP